MLLLTRPCAKTTRPAAAAGVGWPVRFLDQMAGVHWAIVAARTITVDSGVGVRVPALAPVHRGQLCRDA